MIRVVSHHGWIRHRVTRLNPRWLDIIMMSDLTLYTDTPIFEKPTHLKTSMVDIAYGRAGLRHRPHCSPATNRTIVQLLLGNGVVDTPDLGRTPVHRAERARTLLDVDPVPDIKEIKDRHHCFRQ